VEEESACIFRVAELFRVDAEVTLKMETARSCETLERLIPTRCKNIIDDNNFKSWFLVTLFPVCFYLNILVSKQQAVKRASKHTE
jgi:hypothetical protein